jgi:hypothetical protein
MSRNRFLFVLFVPGLLCLAVGCGGGPGTAHVSGKVLLQGGQPLPGGTITFFPVEGGKDRLPVTATIKPDGTYDASAVPVGKVKISISNAALDPRAGTPAFMQQGGFLPGMPSPDKIGPPKGALKGSEPFLKSAKPEGKYVPIDPKYADAEKSGLTYEVRPGDQTHNIEGILRRRSP